MKIIDQDREALYKILSTIYRNNGIEPKIAEVGVLKGKNAENMYNFLKPKKMFLIDSWSAEKGIETAAAVAHRSWSANYLGDYDWYYGGPIDEQKTFDALYEEAQSKFLGKDNVEFIRADSLAGFEVLKTNQQMDLDFIYIDANHHYEHVLDDLMCYKQLLKEDIGCFQLNDCCHSEQGVLQNLGVLEAANKFCKINDFIPVIAVNSDFTDVILAPRKSSIASAINETLEGSKIAYVEVPNELFSNLSIKIGAESRGISFT